MSTETEQLPPGGETSPIIKPITEAQREARMQAAMDAVRNGTARPPKPRPTPDNPHPEEDDEDEDEERDDDQEDEPEEEDEEQSESDEDDDQEGEEEEKPKPAPKKDEKRRRTIGDVMKEKRKENAQLRGKVNELQQQVADLQKARPAPGLDEAKLSEEAQSNPLGFLRRFKVDQAKLYDQLTQRQLLSKSVPEELQDQFAEQQRALDDMQKKLADQDKEREKSAHDARMLDLGNRFMHETRDLTSYPEFDGYSPEELLQGGNTVRSLFLAKGHDPTPKQIAQELNRILAEQHAQIAAREAKKRKGQREEEKPREERPRLRKVAPTERGEVRRGESRKVREPTEKEVEARVERARARARR